MSIRRTWLAGAALTALAILVTAGGVEGQQGSPCAIDAELGVSARSSESVTVDGDEVRDPTGSILAYGAGFSCRVSARLRLGGEVESEGLIAGVISGENHTKMTRWLATLGYRVPVPGSTLSNLRLRAVAGYATGEESLVVIGPPTTGENVIDFGGGGLTAGASLRLPFRLSDRLDLYLEGGWRWHRFDRVRTTAVIPEVTKESAGSEAVHAFPLSLGLTWTP